MTERENRLSPLAVLGDGLLLLCALMGLAGSFLSLYGGVTTGVWDTVRPVLPTALDLCAGQMDLFYLLAGLFALLSLASWSLPRFRWAAAGGSALLLGAAAAARWEQLVQGAGLTVHLISVRFAQRVDWGRVFDYDPGLDPGLTLSQETAAVQLFLVFSLALLALILGWGVVRARRWWIVLGFTLPPLLPGLLADLFPDWLPFMALAACWCAMLLADLCKWAAPSGRGRLTLTALACAAAVLGAVTLAFPRTGYTRPPWALRAEENFYSAVNRAGEFFSRWEGPFQSTVTYVGSAEEADLSSAGPLNYTGRTVLRVRSDYAGRLYLRGSSLAGYEDGVWTAMTDEVFQEAVQQGVSPRVLFFPAMSTEHGPEHTVTVNNVGAVGNCVYAPYFLAVQELEENGMTMVNDSLLARRQGRWSHTLSFLELPEPHTSAPTGDVTIVFTREPRPGADFGRYPQFVLDHYLDVPQDCRDYLTRLCWDNGIYDLGYADPIETAERIAALLDTLCEYDQSAEPPPVGTDPVLYFLTESRRGYCMHYASAAALMLRSLGIPARYVSGFTVESVPDREVTVPDRAAHAWVEVWAPGFGWYPVEVTPAAAFAWDQPGFIDNEGLPSGPVEESEEPEPTPTPSQEPDASQQPSAGIGEGDGPGGSSGLTALFTVLKALGIIAGAAALLWLGQYLPKKRRAKRLSGPDRNRASLYAYGCLKRMERWGGRVDPKAVELAQKARFSQHTLTKEELDGLRELVDVERERLCVILDPLPRLAFRFLWGMPKRPKLGEAPEKSDENGA